jgi:hypothetical protein
LAAPPAQINGKTMVTLTLQVGKSFKLSIKVSAKVAITALLVLF